MVVYLCLCGDQVTVSEAHHFQTSLVIVDDDNDDGNLAVAGGFTDAKLLKRVDPLPVDVAAVGAVADPFDDAASDDEGCLFLAPSFNFSHLSLYLFINASCFLF